MGGAAFPNGCCSPTEPVLGFMGPMVGLMVNSKKADAKGRNIPVPRPCSESLPTHKALEHHQVVLIVSMGSLLHSMGLSEHKFVCALQD